jgi:hypothetical protein
VGSRTDGNEGIEDNATLAYPLCPVRRSNSANPNYDIDESNTWVQDVTAKDTNRTKWPLAGDSQSARQQATRMAAGLHTRWAIGCDLCWLWLVDAQRTFCPDVCRS